MSPGDTLVWPLPAIGNLREEIRLPQPEHPNHTDLEPGGIRANNVAVSFGAGSAAELDAALLEACRRGELAAYEKLYELHASRLKSTAYNLLGSTADAEEAVQEVFLRVYRGIGSFRGQSSFSTWIYRILLNWCQDTWRTRRRRDAAMPLQPPASPGRTPEGQPPDPIEQAPAPAADHPLRLALETAVARLNHRLRQVFLLFEVEGFSHAEIAQMLSLSEATSKNLLYQAKQQLRRQLRSS